LTSAAWGTGDASGIVLLTVPVGPLALNMSYGTGFQTADILPVGYYGLPFSYWRGDMEFLIVVPVSKLHRGSLQIVWVPLDSSPTSEVTNSSINHIFDVSEPRDHIFKVGYARDAPCLDNLLYPLAGAGGPLPIGAYNGMLSVKIVNPLVAQTDAADTIIHVFARGGENMTFGVPRDIIQVNRDLETPSQCIFRTMVTLQGDQNGALGDGESLVPVTVDLVKSGGAYPAADILWGENTPSIRALLQKPSLLGVVTFSESASLCVPRMLQPPKLSDWVVENPLTWATYYSMPFLGFACSERFKILPSRPAWAGACAQHCISNAGRLAALGVLGATMPLTYCGPNMGAEFTVPYYDDKKFRPIGVGQPQIFLTEFTSLTVRTQDGDIEALVYYSFGPDIRATCFRQVPRVVFHNTQSGDALPGWFT